MGGGNEQDGEDSYIKKNIKSFKGGRNMIIEPTWKRAAKVWWAYLFRCWIVRFLFFFVNGIFMTNFDNLLKNENLILFSIFSVIYVIIIIMMAIYPIKMILSKNFGEFRLVLVKTTDAEE